MAWQARRGSEWTGWVRRGLAGGDWQGWDGQDQARLGRIGEARMDGHGAKGIVVAGRASNGMVRPIWARQERRVAAWRGIAPRGAEWIGRQVLEWHGTEWRASPWKGMNRHGTKKPATEIAGFLLPATNGKACLPFRLLHAKLLHYRLRPANPTILHFYAPAPDIGHCPWSHQRSREE